MADYRILVADDHAPMRSLLAHLVEQLGYPGLEFAIDGPEAVRMHRINRYDMILLDNAMPGMTGLEVLRACEADGLMEHTAVVVITAAPHQELLGAIRNAEVQVDDIVLKPFNVSSLKARLSRAIDRHRRGLRRRVDVVRTKLPERAGMSALPKGKQVTCDLVVQRQLAILTMKGLMSIEDQSLFDQVSKTLCDLTTPMIAFDLTNLADIDEFGLGNLLMMNGAAALSGKRTSLILDPNPVRERIEAAGVGTVIPCYSHWSDIADTRVRSA